MYTALQHIHSVSAYLLLLGMVITIIKSLLGWFSNKNFTNLDKFLALGTLIVVHVQFLLGMILYFLSGKFSDLTTNTAEVMHDANARLLSLEHPFTMILGVILVTIGYSRQKRQADSTTKFKTITILFGVGLLLILSRIPWKQW